MSDAGGTVEPRLGHLPAEPARLSVLATARERLDRGFDQFLGNELAAA
jgi:hypothetical protein